MKRSWGIGLIMAASFWLLQPQGLLANVELLRNGDFSSSADFWKKTDYYQSYEWGPRLAESYFSVQDGEAVIDVLRRGQQAWHAHLLQTGLVLEAGQEYQLSFSAKFLPLPGKALAGNSQQPLTVSVIREWGNLSVYFEEVVNLAKPDQWQTFSVNFKAPSTDNYARLDINYGKHGLSSDEPEQFQLRLDNIKLINKSTSNDPRVITDGIGSRQPVSDYGTLYVDDSGRLYSSKLEQPVQLRGMSLHGVQWDHPWYFSNREAMLELKEAWKIDAIRIPVYLGQGGIIDNPSVLLNLETMIKDALDLQLYVLIDWHVHNDQGDPNRYVSEAKSFFAYMAKRFGSEPAVIFEICNEPNGVQWDQIKTYADEIVPVIRQSSDNIIIVGTPTWSQDVDSVIANPVQAENILYAFHFYAASHYLNQFKHKIERALNAGLGIFVTEFGSTNFGGNGQPNFRETSAWLDYLDQRGISWINWNLSAENEESAALKPSAHPIPSQVGGWQNADLTESGNYIKQRLREPSVFDPDADSPQNPSQPEPPSEGAGSLQVDLKLSSDWGQGYCADVLVINQSNQAVVWKVSFEIEGTVTNAWNAEWQQSGQMLTAQAPAEAAALGAGRQASWGFCASR